MTESAVRHPLDPLDLGEIAAIRALLDRDPRCTNAMRVTTLELREPAKPDVLAHRPGDAVVRAGRLVLLNSESGEVIEVIADLTAGRIASWDVVTADGQPPIILDEFFKIATIVKSDPAWRAAVARRGITEADYDLVQVDPFSAGNFGYPEEQGRRLVRAVA